MVVDIVPVIDERLQLGIQKDSACFPDDELRSTDIPFLGLVGKTDGGIDISSGKADALGGSTHEPDLLDERGMPS